MKLGLLESDRERITRSLWNKRGDRCTSDTTAQGSDDTKSSGRRHRNGRPCLLLHPLALRNRSSLFTSCSPDPHPEPRRPLAETPVGVEIHRVILVSGPAVLQLFQPRRRRRRRRWLCFDAHVFPASRAMHAHRDRRFVRRQERFRERVAPVDREARARRLHKRRDARHERQLCR